MPHSPDQLRRDALHIWHAGLDAVRSDRLVRAALRVDGPMLLVGEKRLPLAGIRRIAVVGAGKAGAGMATAVEKVLGLHLMDEKQLTGWINVPADCVPRGDNETVGRIGNPSHSRVHLHAARPAGVNEPTPAGVAGTEEILRLVGALGPDDLCLCLLSGGGSALLPAPVAGISLEDKLAVTRYLSAAGANIEELNTVRKQLSRIKGGGLARACRAGRLVTLIISDVLGDPLDIIASGPTVEDPSTPDAALAVLEKFAVREAGISPTVFDYLERFVVPALAGRAAPSSPNPLKRALQNARVTNLVIGNNATAVEAAGREAARLGYICETVCAPNSEGPAEEVGRALAETALRLRSASGPNCLVSGGEPVVRLVEPSRRGLGGRNQQLVLAALERLQDDGAADIALLSAGTDGEDGPTDAAGAVLDAEIVRSGSCRLRLRSPRIAKPQAATASEDACPAPADYLARNDAYNFFAPLGALIKTGPTHTNVCDVRVIVVRATPDGHSAGP